jgi:ribulose-phosphate 3-epimerase
MIDDAGLKVKIEVDGGVTLDNAKEIIAAGADVLVAGNAVFKSPIPSKTIEMLKSI